MSDHLHAQDEDAPRFDPWLRVMASAIVPVAVALYAHSRFLMPLLATTVVLFVAGLVMLRGQTVRRRVAREELARPPRK